MKSKLFKLALVIVVFSGCASQRAPIVDLEVPPQEIIDTHAVQTGETLYSIAWRYDLNVVKLAKVNGISTSSQIKIGQILNIDTEAVKISSNTQADSPKGLKLSKVLKGDVSLESERSKTSSKKAVDNLEVDAKTEDSNSLFWQWPVKGEVVENFSLKTLIKGIKIKSVARSAVRPALAGEVVYAGDGLRGYGKMIIVKHTDILLSAYALNDQILVREGQTVNTMQIISKLGSSGILYFEIRRDGKPVDPVSYLN